MTRKSYTYGRQYRIGDVEFTVLGDGTLSAEAKNAHCRLGGISLEGADASSSLLPGPSNLAETAKNTPEAIAALRNLADDLENPQERITKPQRCAYWGEPLDGEDYVEDNHGERYHVECAVDCVFRLAEFDESEGVKEEVAFLLARLREKYPAVLAEAEARYRNPAPREASGFLAGISDLDS